jgi:hypothetical protein
MPTPQYPTVRRLTRILAAAYLRLVAARKAATDGENQQNPLDCCSLPKAPCPSRRPARG